MRKDSGGRAAGFTLIETLAALALAGLVSVVLLQGIRLAAAGLDRLSLHADRLDQRRSLDTALRRALAAAILAPGSGGGFAGRADRIDFLTLAEDAGPGLYAVGIAVAAGRAERPLVLTRRLARPAAATAAGGSVLARDIGQFRLAYFGAAAPGAEPGWTDTWEGLGYLPRLVRITIEGGGLPPAPPILVRLWNAG